MPTHLAQGVHLLTRDELGLKPPVKVRRLSLARVGGMTAHYSTGQELGRDDSAAWWRSIQDHHQGPGGLGTTDGAWDMGYHFGVDQHGQVLEGRGLGIVGAHAGDAEGNMTLGVCFLGNDDPDQVELTPQVRHAFTVLHAWASGAVGKLLTRYGHRDWRSTQCPGDELYRWFTADELDDPLWAPSGRHDSTPTTVRPPTPTPAPKPIHQEDTIMANLPTLKAERDDDGDPTGVGSTGLAVSNVQAILRDVHRISADGKLVQVDGQYGPQTHAGVEAFQGQESIGVDGIVGPQTWAKLLLDD